MPETEHRLLTVMFTDIKGYSRMMSEDQAAALTLLTEHNHILESVIDAHGGRIVKKLGDSYMVIFDQGDAAVKCGLHALTKLASRNRQSEKAVEIRVGIHEGAMLERDGDFLGENVNIAARLEQMAEPMAIAVSERVLQQVATRIKCEARFVGAKSLKNLRYPLSVYQMTPSDSWKLYLSPDGPAAGEEHGDVLDEIVNADAAWESVDYMIRTGDLNAAASVAEAALTKFGGTYRDYAHLAAIHLIARMTSEAQSALKMGEMLGRKEDGDEALNWLVTLAGKPVDVWQRSPEELAPCLISAQQYVSEHPEELPMAVLFEGIKARATGHLGGLTVLAQRHPDTALVLRGYAEALRDQAREADAYAMLEKAINVAPGVADHQLRRVQWMVDGGDLDAVLSESEALGKNFPKDGRVYEWTGKTRLLSLDPHGAQWIYEQSSASAGVERLSSARWRLCSLMQQGRLETAVEAARKEMRNAIRQNLPGAAREFFALAATGIDLDHWDGQLELLEEYRRFDADWIFPQAALVAAKWQRQLLPWDRAVSQLSELAGGGRSTGYPHPTGVTTMALLPAARDAEQWESLHNLEFLRAHRDWIIETRSIAMALAELRGALRFGTVDTWHLRLVPLLTDLLSRLDHRLPSLLALAGLAQARLNNFEGGRPHLQQARKLWASADWPVWEIQEAQATLAAGTAGRNPQE